MKKRDLPIDFQLFARIGDAVLNTVAFIEEKKGTFKGFDYPLRMNSMDQYLKSNTFIIHYILPKTNYKQVPNISKLKGDKTEAYIGYLFMNYGFEKARRYVIKQSFRILKNQIIIR